MIARDLFAGTGWGVALQQEGIEEEGVEIMPAAVATREANGMRTIYRDVWDGLTLASPESRAAAARRYDMLIGSPPCTTYSPAGKGAGSRALGEVLESIRLGAYKRPEELLAFGEKHDPRTALVLTPLAHVWRDRPRYVVLEQVPTVLPVWKAFAEVMSGWGYGSDVGILSAEEYGVPQYRKRAILVAKLDGSASLPAPTRSHYYSNEPARLDPGMRRWRSMADALGWGMTDAPFHTITAGTHGPADRWASGGVNVRLSIDAKIGGPNWISRPAGDKPQDPRTKYAERIDVPEASALQTYPSDFVWVGTKTSSFLQVGNAVPPLLGRAIIRAALRGE